jgi:hypothetical protein
LPDFEAISINIVPNPNQGVFQLRMEGKLAGRYDLELLDLQGRAVWIERLQTQGNQVVIEVDVQELPSGVYFLRVGDGTQDVVRKVVLR